jgi:Tfp pilus assembly protein PilV
LILRPSQRRTPSSAGPRPVSTAKGFTIVEVMMASVILVVGFFGMIQAITTGSEMLATARRQTLANQIITHEIEKLRLLPWNVSDAAPNELCIYDLPTASTTITLDPQFDAGIAACGLTHDSITLTRTVSTVTPDLREATFTLTWTKSGTTTAASATSGSWLQKLSFSRSSPIARTYTRIGVAYFTKYGVNLNIQR